MKKINFNKKNQKKFKSQKRKEERLHKKNIGMV